MLAINYQGPEQNSALDQGEIATGETAQSDESAPEAPQQAMSDEQLEQLYAAGQMNSDTAAKWERYKKLSASTFYRSYDKNLEKLKNEIILSLHQQEMQQ